MRSLLAILFGVGTAISNALAVTAQHVASSAGERRGRAWWRGVLRHPLWLLGWIALGSSLVTQAAALHFGPLSLVQPLLVSELVVALVVRRMWRRQHLTRRAWVSALVTSAALAGALLLSQPHGGHSPRLSAWVVASLATTLVVLALVLSARRPSPAWRAGCYGAATALLWAYEAAFIKSATQVLVSRGPTGLFESPTLYGLVVTGVCGLVTEQLALREGPLRISQPLIVIVDPLASVLYGVVLFRERVSHSPVVLVGVALLVAVVVGGVVVMSDSVPETLGATSRNDAEGLTE